LAFESPILGIEKAIFGRGDTKPSPKKQTPEPVAEQVPVCSDAEKASQIEPSVGGTEDPSKA